MSGKAEKLEQISVFLENRAGVVAELCNALTEQQINIQALTVLDSFDVSTMRIIVDRPEPAKEALRTAGAAYVPVIVLGVAIPNVPGSLGQVARKIAEAGVNIEYMYASTLRDADRVYVIIRVADAHVDTVLGLDFDAAPSDDSRPPTA